MKYKNIKAMSHNFAYSFLSLTNYVDDDYVADDLFEQARKINPEEKLVVQIWPEDLDQDKKFSLPVQKLISFYREQLPKHCQSHDIEIGIIKLLQLQILKNSSHQLLSYVYAVDDKDKEYKQYIKR